MIFCCLSSDLPLWPMFLLSASSSRWPLVSTLNCPLHNSSICLVTWLHAGWYLIICSSRRHPLIPRGVTWHNHDNAGVWCQVACGPDPSAACGKLVWIESKPLWFCGWVCFRALEQYFRDLTSDMLALLQSALCEQLTLATRALCANNLVLYVNIYEFWCTWSRITSGWQNINLAVMQYSVHTCCWCCSQGL